MENLTVEGDSENNVHQNVFPNDSSNQRIQSDSEDRQKTKKRKKKKFRKAKRADSPSLYKSPSDADDFHRVDDPKSYQMLPILDLGVEEEVAGDTERPYHDALTARKARKSSDITPRYVEHYKHVLRQRHGVDFTPRKSDRNVSKAERSGGDDVNLQFLPQPNIPDNIRQLPALKTQGNHLKSLQGDKTIRKDILRALELVDDQTKVQEHFQKEKIEDIYMKLWFSIETDIMTVRSGDSLDSKSETLSQKPLPKRVDDVIKEFELVPGLMSRRVSRRKLGGVVSPRRLSELMNSSSPIRMVDRFNHYL